ncbi:hypothetical protein Tco_0752394 [Tanacetum coccineum]|uniref:Uncharacterized protein n=1 Tax=Tanacetum coccineum TaxID=301880 RepID=A0ABQ4ZAF9_9ASTR
MPPKQYPPSVLESIASIADLLSKLVASQTTFNDQLKIIIKKQQQTLSLISPIVQTNQRDSNTPTIATPPTSTQPIITLPPNNHGLQIRPATPEKPMAQVITVPSSSITKMENEVTAQHQTPLLPALAPPTNPVNKSLKVQHEIVILHPTHLYNQTCHLATLAKDKFTLGQVGFSYSNCFSSLKPPKFVFLQTQPKPPWERRDPMYKTMSLEDKTHFEARSIDTCKQLKTKSSWNNSPMHCLHMPSCMHQFRN